MKKHALFLGFILAVAAASGCAQVLSPFPYGPYSRLPYPARSPVVPIDPTVEVRGRWDQVMRLPARSVIDVLTMNGAHVGHLTTADGYTVKVMVNGIEEAIARADVLRIDLVDLPGSEAGAVAKRAAGGALLGVGAAALVGAVIGAQAWPPPGAMLRGGAAIGGLAGAQATLAARQRRLVYLAEKPFPIAGSSSRAGAFEHRDDESLHVVESHAVQAWSAISALRRGELVRVLKADRRRHLGRLTTVDDTSIRLDIDGAELRIPRPSIERVDVVRGRESDGPRRRDTGLIPRPGLGIAGAVSDRFSSEGFVPAPGAAPLVRMGLPMLPFGGAQPQILQFQVASNHLVAVPGGAPSPSLAPAPRPMRASICHGTGVRMRR